MKAAIYSPYLDTYGGGERYMMTIAETLCKRFDVDVLLDNHLFPQKDKLKNTLSERFNLNLDRVSFIKAPIGIGSTFFQRISFLKKYEILFYLTDGSIFYSSAKKNILHIQSPIKGQAAKSLWGKLKLKGWNLIIFNSQFTKEHSQKYWPIRSSVIYPPVDVEKIKSGEKKKYILSVGRFFGYLKDKKHEVMIDSFKDLINSKKAEGWSLILAGSASAGDEDYLKSLQERASNFPVKFYPNLNYEDLVKLYGESTIYWHAAGYEELDPTKMEHFGITTVEAMGAGCVPIVIAKGGQVEIVGNKISGYIWQNLDELKDLTEKLINDEGLRKQVSLKAIQRAKEFSKSKFEEKIESIS